MTPEQTDLISGALLDLMRDERLANVPPRTFFTAVLSVTCFHAKAAGVNVAALLAVQAIANAQEFSPRDR